MSYYKGYKVNSRILKAIQNDSGYNDKSHTEIERVLSGLGYTIDGSNAQSKCPSKKGKMNLVTASSAFGKDTSYLYCVYYNANDTSTKDKKNSYYSYGVVTYIYVDLPIVGQFKVPVYTKGERIYRFTGSCQVGSDGGCRRV